MDWSRYFVYGGDAGTSTADPNGRKTVMSSVTQPPGGRRQVLFSSVAAAAQKIMRAEDISAQKDGSAWGNPVVVDSVSASYDFPCLLIDSDGYLHALYRRKLAGGYYTYRYAKSTDGGATWGSYANVPFPYSTQSVSWPSACVCEDGKIYAIGSQKHTTAGYRFYCYRRSTGGVWSSFATYLPRAYPSATQIVAVPSVSSFVKDGVQHLEVIFIEKNSSGVYKLTNVYTYFDGFAYTWVLYPGPSPSTPYVDYESVTNVSYPSMAVDLQRQKVCAVYQKLNSSGIYQIYFKKKSLLGSDWGSAVKVNIAEALVGAVYPSITIGVDGRLYVAWQQKNSGIAKGGGSYAELS